MYSKKIKYDDIINFSELFIRNNVVHHYCNYYNNGDEFEMTIEPTEMSKSLCLLSREFYDVFNKILNFNEIPTRIDNLTYGEYVGIYQANDYNRIITACKEIIYFFGKSLLEEMEKRNFLFYAQYGKHINLGNFKNFVTYIDVHRRIIKI